MLRNVKAQGDWHGFNIPSHNLEKDFKLKTFPVESVDSVSRKEWIQICIDHIGHNGLKRQEQFHIRDFKK